MSTPLAELAAIVAPTFVGAAIGFIWTRAGRQFHQRFVTALVTSVGTPFLVFSALTKHELDLAILTQMAAATLLAFCGFAAVSILILRLVRLPLHSFLPALMFPNSGNMGLPLCLYAFGEKGLALAIVFFSISATLQFTVGIGLSAGSADPRRLLRMPLTYAVLAALVVMIWRLPVPGWLANTSELLGGITIPLMLIALGVSLAELKVNNLGRSLALSLARIVPGSAIGFAVGWLLGLNDQAIGVLTIQSGMPVAVFNYLFAQMYNRQPVEVAGMVFVSTLLSFAVIPVLLIYLL
ncbi:MAG: AEC family transporter [Dongiaceae bacterium]